MTATMITTVDLGATKQLQSGDRIRVKGMGTFIVTDNDDPALIVVRSQHGVTLRLGRLIVQLDDVQGMEAKAVTQELARTYT